MAAQVRNSILAFATKGAGTNEERRLRQLLSRHDVRFLAYDKAAKRRSFFHLLRTLHIERPALLVMEGTGIAGGLACLLSRLCWKQRYVVSSGDAVGPFVGGIIPLLGPAFGFYERLLCRNAAGFIGWTPYLVGRALTFGAPRAMTAAGWSEQAQPSVDARERIRAKLNIPADAIVFGLVGSLVWNRRHQYCYGLELVRAIRQVQRRDLRVLIVGDGSGLPELEKAAGDRLNDAVIFTGPVSADEVVDYMAAMDVGSLPQSVDKVGSFRYTTKICEYLAAQLPIVTGHIPLAYDLGDSSWMWRLPGANPWSTTYVQAMSQLMENVSLEAIDAARRHVPQALPVFDPTIQVDATTRFIADLL